MVTVFLVFTFLISPTIGDNITHDDRHISDHPLHKGWIVSSVFSIIGVLLNSLVLFIFFQERNSLITAVNVMIMFVHIDITFFYTRLVVKRDKP